MIALASSREKPEDEGTSGWNQKELHAHLDFAAAVDVKLLRLLYHTLVLEVS